MATRSPQPLFQVDDPVVYAACGIGRIAALVTKRFQNLPDRMYYEVAVDRSTIWVAVDAGPESGLRLLTLNTELPNYRAVLRGRPGKLAPDARQRRLEVTNRLKVGTFLAMCEVVRDLAAQGWAKTLNEADALALRRTREGLCQEWAAAAGLELGQATAEVNALLQEGRQAYAA